jgi:hypothetical protein
MDAKTTVQRLGVWIAAIQGVAGAAPDLVTNGDFQTGGLAPSESGYAQSATMGPPNTWNIVVFDTLNGSWADFFDHTEGDGDGFFMIVNGSDSGAGPAWAQTIAVEPGRGYTVSAHVANAYGAGTASLEFRVDGVLVGEPFSAGDAGVTGVWTRREAGFTAGALTEVRVEIWDTNLMFNGNDYAIDDVAVTPTTCGPADLAPPFGVLDLSDINAFVAAFTGMDPAADLTDDGVYDLADINLFVASFVSGCP